MKHLLVGLFASFALLSSFGGSQDGRNDPNERIYPPGKIDTPANTLAYPAEAVEKGRSLLVRGECIVMFAPTEEELKSAERSVKDQLRMWKSAVDSIRIRTQEFQIPVYFTTQDSIVIAVSQSRSTTIKRSDRSERFGAVFCRASKGPFFLDGIRPADDVLRFIHRYFDEH